MTIFVAVFGLFWLAAGITGVTAVVFAVSKWRPLRKELQKHSFLSGFLLLLSVVIFAVLLRVFVFEVYSIPSGSMEKTLLPGDKILVSKLAFGPALPRSPLEVPWFNAFFLFNKQAIAKNDTFVWDYHRLRGIRNLQRGEVVVFRFPPDPRENYIKRCVALPGDTVQVIAGILYVNSIQQAFPSTAKTEYKVWFHDLPAFQHLLDSLHLSFSGPWDRKRENYRILNLTTTEMASLIESAFTDSMAVHVLNHRNTGYAITDNYGPFIVPYKGMNILLNKENRRHYKTILQVYEGLKTGDEPGRQYRFKQDYYFMMGDNRHNSTDSRVWGAVPEELITGKATRVLWSAGYWGFRWERIFRKIQ
jgi:signal peptidase I